jgi:hypothetical protein
MSCTTWNDSLTGRLYGEIEAEDEAALTAHLATCASCRKTLDEFRRVRTLLREDEPDTPPVPRVVVLRDRSRIRPALLAASLLGAAVLAGAGAGAGYALGLGHAPAPAAVATTTSAAPGVSTEELVRREVDRRIATLQDPRTIAAGSKSGGSSADPAGERPISPQEIRAEFAKFERRLNGARAADLDYVLDQIAASEVRIAARLGKTNQALRSVALASNPYVNEQ